VDNPFSDDRRPQTVPEPVTTPVNVGTARQPLAGEVQPGISLASTATSSSHPSEVTGPGAQQAGHRVAQAAISPVGEPGLASPGRLSVPSLPEVPAARIPHIELPQAPAQPELPKATHEVDPAKHLATSRPDLGMPGASPPRGPSAARDVPKENPAPVQPATRADPIGHRSPPQPPANVGAQEYPDDSPEELQRIADSIRAEIVGSVPQQRVRANAFRIRGLLKLGFKVKQVYAHLVGAERIDAAQVSYKQFAGEVRKLREQSS